MPAITIHLGDTEIPVVINALENTAVAARAMEQMRTAHTRMIEGTIEPIGFAEDGSVTWRK